MIKINGHKLNATIFPDKTSQVWQLPEWVLQSSSYWIDWRWESESEILQLAQLMELLFSHNPEGAKHCVLYVPYLPYARQDKKVGNYETFALHTLGSLINAMQFEKVITLDVHNEAEADSAIRHLQNIPPVDFHDFLMQQNLPDRVIFPDLGAQKRYPHLNQFPRLIFKKERDSATGRITHHELYDGSYTSFQQPTYMVVDDICDGGATFISVAEAIEKVQPHAKLILAVTHGIFSKGYEELLKHYPIIRATNSLPNLAGAYEV